MRIPKKLKIGGHWIDVIFPYIFTERTDRLADFDFCLKKIRIAEYDLCNEKRALSGIIVSMIHEILHAIDCQNGHQIFEDKIGENALCGLSEGIYQVLIDNGFLK